MRVEEYDGVQRTTEDYLEAILMIQERQGYVRSVDVANQLGVTKPSVTYTTKRLKEKGLITSDHAGMLILTAAGTKVAQATYDRHRKLTAFFVELGVGAEQARTDACKIEHDISEESFKALCRFVDKSEKKAPAKSAAAAPKKKASAKSAAVTEPKKKASAKSTAASKKKGSAKSAAEVSKKKASSKSTGGKKKSTK